MAELGQNIYFYFNHPIRFVYVVGVILAHDDYPRRTILVLDDSSGATVEVIILKKVPPRNNNDHGFADMTANGWNNPQTTAFTGTGGPSATRQSVQVNLNRGTEEMRKAAGSSNDTSIKGSKMTAMVSNDNHIPLQLQLPQHMAGTTNLPIQDISSLKPGLVVKVKGTLSVFRSSYQIILEKFEIISGNTAAEMRFWDERSRFLIDVLSVPWSLTTTEVADLRKEYQLEEENRIERRKRAEEWKSRWEGRDERHRRRILKAWEREERMRRQEAERCKEESERFMIELLYKRRMVRHR